MNAPGWGGSCMSIGVASLVIVDFERLAVLEAEHDAPVGAHRHGPEAGKVSFERVKPEARDPLARRAAPRTARLHRALVSEGG